jgi:hypothetical protein
VVGFSCPCEEKVLLSQTLNFVGLSYWMTCEKRQIRKHIVVIFGCRKALDELAMPTFTSVPFTFTWGSGKSLTLPSPKIGTM